MKKKIILMLTIAFAGMILLACGKEDPIMDNECEINVFKEEYAEEKKHREDPLDIEKGDTRIEVNITVTSGEFKITFLDKNNEALSYEYIVEKGDTVADTIQLGSDAAEDSWVLIMDKNEDTEASLKYVIK